ncbi:alpha/beta hydrolase [Corynebacterium suranareeae]|uniref:Alpha/beta hydrolase n=1 Tax=Corynebacterium suranareeae TaxID=2506452 RepID=A0A160PT71_9CORY|nr:alpha/beta hydrolase [Corynebacterium suranareeae]BAU96984.1 alpha/beta hydrolase [Corynebacterium suranareeae]
MPNPITAPPFDPELEAVLSTVGVPPTMTAEMLPEFRKGVPGMAENFIEEFIAKHDLEQRDETVTGYNGDDIAVTIFTPRGVEGTRPAVFHTHGGGMILGDRFVGLKQISPWIDAHKAIVVTVEYRLAPEFPDPYPVEDCYAALAWTAENATDLGIDPERIIIAGASAGGGLAAGTALLARDRKGPKLFGQVLMCPMLDDRDATISTQQIDGIGVWDRGSNLLGWNSLLGDRRGTDDVSIYAAPARATDLSGLPPAFIDTGSAEVFRDEDIAYANRIWEAGGVAELHVWQGGFHGFEGLVPHASVSQMALAARNNWVDRLLNG